MSPSSKKNVSNITFWHIVMLVTDWRVTNMQKNVTNILFCHQDPKIVINIKSQTSRCHQHHCHLNYYQKYQCHNQTCHLQKISWKKLVIFGVKSWFFVCHRINNWIKFNQDVLSYPLKVDRLPDFIRDEHPMTSF